VRGSGFLFAKLKQFAQSCVVKPELFELMGQSHVSQGVEERQGGLAISNGIVIAHTLILVG